MADKKIIEVENDIRDIINWLVIFQEEYGIDEEAVDVLRAKLEKLAKKVGGLK